MKDIGIDISKVAVGAVAGWWLGLNPIVQLLIILMGLDIVTGILGAFVSKTIDSGVSFHGICRKAMILMLVLAASLLSTYASALGMAWQVPLGEAVAGFFVANELLSIVENAGIAGVPIPAVLKDALSQLSKKGQT